MEEVVQLASHEALWYSGHGRPAWRTHLLAIAITSGDNRKLYSSRSFRDTIEASRNKLRRSEDLEAL